MSKYNFNFAVSAELNEDTVKSMIKQVVEEQTGRRVSRVELNLSKVLVGYGRDEHDETMFTGATVYFQGE